MNKLIFKLFYSEAALIAFFLISSFLLNGCDSKLAGNIVKEISKEPEIYFCPKDDCSKVFEINIAKANNSVYCAFYDLDLKNIIAVLVNKNKNTDVKLVMDESNYKEQIKGNAVRLDNDKQLMHNKFCVIDDSIVITGSFNPTYNDNNLNNNNVVVLYSHYLAENYNNEFSELWDKKFGGGNKVIYPVIYINETKIENYFCPEDKCAYQIIKNIDAAEKSIYFMSFSFTNEEIADALVKKSDLDIRGIFDTRQAASKFSQFKRLNDFGVNVRKDKNKYTMHHKVFIIDNETVITGSFNPTLAADTKNDENILIIHNKNIANKFLKEFDSLW